MNVHKKDATITNTGPDNEFPGSFRVILSTPEQDRDGDELLTKDWELPLPGHITFDQDHAMSVAGTVGSGTPTINADGDLIVEGTYSSLTRAQEVRTLVKEGHIRTTSVAFLTKSVTKGGQKVKVRELLNGAFVAVPSNRGALVLDSKGATGPGEDAARHIRAIHDAAVALGVQLAAGPDVTAEHVPVAKSTTGKLERRMVAAKTVAGSYEQRQQALSDALDAAYPDPANGYVYAYPLATFDESVVYRVSGDTDDRGQWQASYTVEADGTITLGEPARVTMVEQVVPVKAFAPDEEEGTTDPEAKAADSSAAPAATKAAAAAETSAAEADQAEALALQGRALAARATAWAAI